MTGSNNRDTLNGRIDMFFKERKDSIITATELIDFIDDQTLFILNKNTIAYLDMLEPMLLRIKTHNRLIKIKNQLGL